MRRLLCEQSRIALRANSDKEPDVELDERADEILRTIASEKTVPMVK